MNHFFPVLTLALALATSSVLANTTSTDAPPLDDVLAYCQRITDNPAPASDPPTTTILANACGH